MRRQTTSDDISQWHIVWGKHEMGAFTGAAAAMAVGMEE
jgi:uncharacterized protein YegJ (DUF2314 family)